MLKFLISIMLVSCGQDDSLLNPSVSPSPSPATTATEVSPQESAKTASANKPAASQSVASPTPSPSAAPYQSLHLIVQQAFENDQWKFDFTQSYNVFDNGMKYTTPRIMVTRKIASGNYVCPFHTTILIGETYGTVTFTTDFTTTGCGTTGTQFMFNYKIKNNLLETF